MADETKKEAITGLKKKTAAPPRKAAPPQKIEIQEVAPATASNGGGAPMSGNQGGALFLLIVLIALGAARSPNVRGFFSTAFGNISGNLQARASNQASTSTDTLGWHVFLYWFVGAILVIALSDVAPQLTFGLLFLIIVEELLLHWSTYAQLLQMPTK